MCIRDRYTICTLGSTKLTGICDAHSLRHCERWQGPKCRDGASLDLVPSPTWLRRRWLACFTAEFCLYTFSDCLITSRLSFPCIAAVWRVPIRRRAHPPGGERWAQECLDNTSGVSCHVHIPPFPVNQSLIPAPRRSICPQTLCVDSSIEQRPLLRKEPDKKLSK